MSRIASRVRLQLGTHPGSVCRVAAALVVGLGVSVVPVCAADHDTTAPTEHPALILVDGAYRIGAGASPEPVADVSTYCRSCHGVIGTEGATGGSRIHIGAADRGHPVDLPYPESAPELVPRRELAAEIVLLDGAITCLSCHDAQRGGRGLTKPATDSELCRACHVK